MLIDHDLHVHTNLSSCSTDEEATPQNIIIRAADFGIKTIGFANHMWDKSIPGPDPFYVGQDYEHIMKIQDQIPQDTHGVSILTGCESEYCGDGKVGISMEVANKLEFVLLPMSHLHFKGFVEPVGITALSDVAALMVKRFKEVIELGIATGIAHPFLPIGYYQHVDEIIAEIPDDEFKVCFSRAAELGVSIEVTTGFFPGCLGIDIKGYHDTTFLRVLSIAKKCGCYFHFASDAHKLKNIGDVLKLEKYADALGITRNDILPLLRR
jgi:histidinol phosphatase-like PHP family hydrolase